MNIQQAAGHLQRQGLCIYPTETFFAIGCDACNSAAVDRLLKCKERPHTQGLPVIIGGREQLALACDLEPTEQFPTVIRDFAETLMERFWPGPLSLILPASKALAPGVGRGGSVALRWTPHPVAQALCLLSNTPLVASSANLRHGLPVTKAENLNPALLAAVEAVLDLPPQPSGGAPSTLVRPTLDAGGRPALMLIRAGAVSQATLEQAGYRICPPKTTSGLKI